MYTSTVIVQLEWERVGEGLLQQKYTFYNLILKLGKWEKHNIINVSPNWCLILYFYFGI